MDKKLVFAPVCVRDSFRFLLSLQKNWWICFFSAKIQIFHLKKFIPLNRLKFSSGVECKMAFPFQSQCQTLEMRVSGSWRLLVCHWRHGFTQSWALGFAPQNGGTLRSCSRQVDGNHFHERSSIRMRRGSLSSIFTKIHKGAKTNFLSRN